MKLWCQSCGAFGKDPIWSDYEKALKKRAREVARPDTVVELHGQEATIPGIDRYYASAVFCMEQSVRNAIRAEREGYDAFVMISNLDAGYYEIRELVDIPVVFMLESSIHFALTLAPKFALFTHNEGQLARLIRIASQYGLTEHMTPPGFLDLTYSVWPDLYGHPERYIDTVTQKAREVIANGAGVLIPSALPLGAWLVEQGITEIDGACILDGFGYIIKMAELMVDLKKLGVKRRKYGPPQKEMLEAIQKLYVR